MTPVETMMSIEASIWREELRQQMNMVQAWSIAKMIRAKNLPSLKNLLAKPAKPLHGKELDNRRREFAKMTANIDLSKLLPKKTGMAEK